MLSKIPELMATNNMTVSELSKTTGLSRTTLTPLAASNEVPSKTRIQTLLKVSEALHTPLSRMVFENISIKVLDSFQLIDTVNKESIQQQLLSISYDNEKFNGSFILMSRIFLPSLDSFSPSDGNISAEQANVKKLFSQLGVTKANSFMALSMQSTSELMLTAKETSEEASNFVSQNPILNSDDAFSSTFSTVEIELTIKAIAKYFREQQHTTFSQITWDSQISAMPTIDKDSNTELFFSTNTFDTEPRYRPSIL